MKKARNSQLLSQVVEEGGQDTSHEDRTKEEEVWEEGGWNFKVTFPVQQVSKDVP